MLIGEPVQEMQFPGRVLPIEQSTSPVRPRNKVYGRFVLGLGFSHL